MNIERNQQSGKKNQRKHLVVTIAISEIKLAEISKEIIIINFSQYFYFVRISGLFRFNLSHFVRAVQPTAVINLFDFKQKFVRICNNSQLIQTMVICYFMYTFKVSCNKFRCILPSKRCGGDLYKRCTTSYYIRIIYNLKLNSSYVQVSKITTNRI